MLDALVKSDVLDPSKALAVNHVMGASKYMDLKARLITYYQNICPAHWFEVRPSLRGATAPIIMLKAPLEHVDNSYVGLQKYSTFSSPTIYFKGWYLQICLDISGDFPTCNSAKVSIVHKSAAQTLGHMRNPSPLMITVLSPLGRVIQTHLIIMESPMPGEGRKTVLFENMAGLDTLWRASAVGPVLGEDLTVTVSVSTV
jgi:hypothetical protein